MSFGVVAAFRRPRKAQLFNVLCLGASFSPDLYELAQAA
jgi:hypothetical protein